MRILFFNRHKSEYKYGSIQHSTQQSNLTNDQRLAIG